MAKKPYVDRRELVRGDTATLKYKFLAKRSPRQLTDLEGSNMVFTLIADGVTITKSTDDATLTWIEEGGVKCGVQIDLGTDDTNWKRPESRPKFELKRLIDTTEKTLVQGVITPIGFL